MPQTRAQQIKIHIAIKKLGLSDENYRDILFVNFEARSSTTLNHFQANQLLDIFKAKGWKVKRKKDNDFSKTYPDRHMSKVQALWITLEKAGVIRKRGDKAMNKFVRRMTKKDNLKWCDGADCDLLIEGLKAIGKRNDINFN